MKSIRLTVLAVGLAGVLGGCSSTPQKNDMGVPAEPVSEAEKRAGHEGGLPVRSDERGGVEVLPVEQQEAAEATEGLAPDEMGAATDQEQAVTEMQPVVYFDYDSDVVSEEGRQVIQFYARKLLDQPDVRVRLEGHTDERGSPEYNLALGERRAKAVKEALVLYGVSPERIEVVSYGEAHPAVNGHDESAWAKNRRVELVFVR